MIKRAIAAVLASILVALPPGQAAAAQLGRMRAGVAGNPTTIVPKVAPSQLGASFKPAFNATLNSGLPVLAPVAAVAVPGAQPLFPGSNPLAETAAGQLPVTIHQLAELSAEVGGKLVSGSPDQAKTSLDSKFDASKKGFTSGGDEVRGTESSRTASLGKSPAKAKARARVHADDCPGGSCGIGPAAQKAEKKPATRAQKIIKAAAWTAFGAAAAVAAAKIGVVAVAVIGGSLLLSVLIHESAHILGLRVWGDPTPKEAGRDTINPLKHISLVGTVLVPAASIAVSMATIGFPVLFGWGKPVPVDFNRLKNPKTDAAKVAMLGPASNLLLAGVAGLALLALPAGGVAALVAATLFKMNLALTVFNLLPLPHLDGGKLLVSLLPKSAYARWTHNPNLKPEYQGLYQRIYEGPSNLLSKLHVHSLEHVNGLTRVVSLAALAAFYAIFFTTLSVPLLFMALPCSYDYWCIREKVRSEAAVKDLMDIMSQWSTVIVQVAEDLGVESEVSAYETEHAMKNALETIIDELMEKEDFRALSDEEKIEAVMKAYPDKAAEFMKDKAMTEDTLETIKKVLADERNKPFYHRVRNWMKDHEVFKKWGNAHAKEKLKDSLKEADKPKQKGSGGGTGGTVLGVLAIMGFGLGASFFPDAATYALAALGGLGMAGVMRPTDDDWDLFGDNEPPRQPSGGDWTSKVRAHEQSNYSETTVFIWFAEAASNEQKQQLMSAAATRTQGADGGYFAAFNRIRDSAEFVRELANSGLVTRIEVHPAVAGLLRLPSASSPQADGSGSVAVPITPDSEVMQGRIKVVFRSEQKAREHLSRVNAAWGSNGAGNQLEGANVNVPEGFTTQTLAEELARHGDAFSAIFVPGPGSAADLRASLAKLGSDSRVQQGQAWVEAAEGQDGSVEEYVRELGWIRIGERAFDGRRWSTWSFPEGADAPAQALQAAGLSSVAGVTLTDQQLTAAQLRVSGKITSEGYPSEGRLELHVRFYDNSPAAEMEAVFARHPGLLFVTEPDSFRAVAPGLEQAVEAARSLAAEKHVVSVTVHPAVEGKVLRPKPEPWGDADPARSVLVQFAEDASDSNLEAYATANDLRLVDKEYRGGANLGLFELPQGTGLTEGITALHERLAGGMDPKVRTIRALKESAVAEPSAEAVSQAVQAEPEKAKPQPRDVQAAWLDFLNTRVLADGKSTLTPKQVQALSIFLKPMQATSDAPVPPMVGRIKELKRIIPIVTSPRGMRNSVIIVGEAGVGKTAIYEGLAQLIEEAENPGAGNFMEFERLKGRWLVELDLDELMSAEEPVAALKLILDLLPRLNDADPGEGNKVLVVMDELQKMLMDQAGTKMANSLKGVLRKGRFSSLAATTEKEYKKFIEPDDAFRRRYELVRAEEPTVEETIAMLRGAKAFLEKLHSAVIPDAVLVAAAKLHHQFDKLNFNPDKSFKGVQDSAELSRPGNLRGAIRLDIRETWRELQNAVYEARQALLDKNIASALALPLETYNKLAELSRKAAGLYEELAAVADGKGQVTVDVIKRNLTAKTGIASGQLSQDGEDTSRYVKMEETINQEVINQERAIKALASAIRRNKAGISDPSKPMAKFMFVGPTGTGKTYLAKRLAYFLFHDEEAMIRVDMSEYMEKHEVAKLGGAPPGYIGYEEGGQLTEKVRKKPYSVILFDEIEKAHPDVWNMLLQVLDDGRLTDGQGRVTDFKNTVILLSSNVGMTDVDGEGFERDLAEAKTDEERAKIEAAWDAAIAEAIRQGVRSHFRPEFINRLDEDPSSKNKYVIFERLKRQHMGKIARLEVAVFQKLLRQVHGTELVIADEVYDLLAVEGYSPQFGARPVKSAISKLIIDPLAQWILAEMDKGRSEVRGGLIRVGRDAATGNLVFEAMPKPEKVIERVTVAGAAEALVQGVLKLVEGAGDFGATELEALLKGPEAPKKEAAAAPQASIGYKPGAGLSFQGSKIVAQHNNPGKKDDDMRYAAKTLPAAAKEALWPEATVGLVGPEAGQVGTGWLKHFVKHAKERASKAGQQKPVELRHEINTDVLRLAITSPHKMGDEERHWLDSHFTGKPVESYLAAQQKADNLNLNSAMVWDHNLLDLYRRFSAIPDASWGWSVGPEGTTYWLEVKRQQAKADDGQASLTPHQRKENAKVRSLFWRVVSAKKDDGHAMLVAASRGFVDLSGPEQLAEARQKLAEGGYAGHGTEEDKLQEDWGVVMTLAGVLGRFGTRDDIPALEVMAKRLTSSAHNYVPLHNAFVEALTELYARAGLPEAKAALARAEGNSDIERASRRAFGRVGGPSELKELVRDGEAYADYLLRHGGGAEPGLLEGEQWEKLPTSEKIARLRVIAKTGGAEFLPALGKMMTKDGGRATKYNVARAWAEICARLGLTRNLTSALDRYLDKNTLTSSDSHWEYFLALVYLAELSGDADAARMIEEAMSRNAAGISSYHEQAYFSLPMAWAAIVVRNGLFGRLTEKLQTMLASHKPMEASAAVHALALARQFRRERAVPPTGNVPPQEGPSSSGGSSQHGDFGL